MGRKDPELDAVLREADSEYPERLQEVKRIVSRASFVHMTLCIGCGYCCRKTTCHLGSPGGEFGCCWLQYNGEKWRCGLLSCEDLKEENEHLRNMLYIGGGCCAGLNDWRRIQVAPDPDWIREKGESSRGYRATKGGDDTA